MKAAHVKKSIGPVIMGIALVWMVSAPWLSAHRFISVGLEMDCYLRCFLVLVCGVYVFNRLGENTGIKRAIRIAISTIVIICGLEAWLGSNYWFARWKLASISDAGWRQMSSDLEKLTNDKLHHGVSEGDLKFAELPESLRVLGREEDFSSYSYYQVSKEGKGTTAYVTFGQLRRRCWGIHVGPEQGDIFRGCRKIPVSTNAFCFFGVKHG